MANCPIVILGAGPYGLAAAAHLRPTGLETRVFGRTMDFWRDQMPRGMYLRSSWDANHISDPQHCLTLDVYEQAHGASISKPVPLENFIGYGKWFQQRVVPDLDTRWIRRIEAAPPGFRLTLEDGELLMAQRVVIAAGISRFAHRPNEFDGLPAALVSHSADHSDLARFAGRQVIVVGGGQSAVESAALLSQAGADVELIMRSGRLRWLRRSGWLHTRGGPIRQLLYPPTDVGPPGLNQIVARPDLFRRLPRELQERIAYRSIRPAAAGWLFPRIGDVRFTTSRTVISAARKGQRISISLDDGTSRTVDHVLLATGYRVDLSGYRFLSPELLRSVQRVDGYPLLNAAFESSVPGLHFLGAPAAWSFGPLMRFVSGTEFTARALLRAVMAESPMAYGARAA